MSASSTRGMIRITEDFLFGLTLFVVICGVSFGGTGSLFSALFPGSAQAGVLDPAGHVPTGMADGSLLILGLEFASLVAIDLWFARHLRRAYASPRRGGWRRG